MDMQWIQIKVTGKTEDLDNISADKFGAKDFTEVTQKDYHKYLPVEEEPEADAE